MLYQEILTKTITHFWTRGVLEQNQHPVDTRWLAPELCHPGQRNSSSLVKISNSESAVLTVPWSASSVWMLVAALLEPSAITPSSSRQQGRSHGSVRCVMAVIAYGRKDHWHLRLEACRKLKAVAGDLWPLLETPFFAWIFYMVFMWNTQWSFTLVFNQVLYVFQTCNSAGPGDTSLES